MTPAWLVRTLIEGRTALLRSVSPVDALYRRLTGRSDLPPLWLRRHAGPTGRFESAARDAASLIEQLGLVREGDPVLDVGCGPAAMAPHLRELIGAEGRYIGFDVHAPSIAWARRRFADDPRFRFELAALASPYGGGGAPVEKYRFPADDASAGFVLAKSVFTHLLESEARHYLSEIRRVLASRRTAMITSFLFEPESRTGLGHSRRFPFADRAGTIRFRSRVRPQSAIAYERSLFLSMLDSSGLRIGHEILGFYPGNADPPTGQDVLLLGRA
jgi:SAM-dependent methyltransferase